MDERAITTHHEAGHAVAASMRGGSEPVSVTIEPTDGHLGYTRWCGKPCDNAFITFAGPWAEARAQWPLPILDGEDTDGATFADYIAAAWLRNRDGDAADYQRATQVDRELLGDHYDEVARESIWQLQLERQWSAIQAQGCRATNAANCVMASHSSGRFCAEIAH
ncbi:hypothetical protein [Mycolicibacterium wolinskyi]|uniref:hypothetical protein n=1 Tax=Mycolicibacterium wolinskyi TaxID=59750 RepID=UPI0039178980